MTKQNLSLEERLDRLESIEEICQLKYRYLAATDADYDSVAMANVFTEDGEWAGHGIGREAIAADFADEDTRIPHASHMVANPEIDVDIKNNRATGHWWLIMPCVKIIDGEEKAAWLLGEYNDIYRRENGEWLVERMSYTESFFLPINEDWSEAWAKNKTQKTTRALV